MTERSVAEAYILSLFEHLLGRVPNAETLTRWADQIAGGMPEREVFRRIVSGPEYRRRNKVIPGFPSGHFYSPIVDPDEVRDYYAISSQQTEQSFHGIPLDIEAMAAFWRRNEDCLRHAPFTERAGGASRYYASDGRYPKGDALVLMAMINTHRPKHVIEIGSGFSSAAMLDTADHLDLTNFRLTCIDPYADRLRSLLRPHDHARVRIIEQKVQTVPISIFEALSENDILFIDSSHVLKTGSDVHYELFSILPSLQPGVLIHFHDIQFPFEYPAEWVFNKRWSWNEIYAVRAFLMFNKEFEVKFFTHLFLLNYASLIEKTLHLGRPLIGGSIWIERMPSQAQRDGP